MCPKHFSERETTRFSLFCNSNVDRKFFFKKRPFYKEVNIEYTPKSGKKIKVFLYLTCLLLYIDNVCITKIQRWKGEWDLKYIYFTVQDVVKKEKPSDHFLQDGSKDQIESRGIRACSSSIYNQLSLCLAVS